MTLQWCQIRLITFSLSLSFLLPCRDILCHIGPPATGRCSLLHTHTFEKTFQDAELDSKSFSYFLVWHFFNARQVFVWYCPEFDEITVIQWVLLMFLLKSQWHAVILLNLLSVETCNWIMKLQVALKTLIVIHRILREGDPSFKEDLVKYSHRVQFLHISSFKDDSTPLGKLIGFYRLIICCYSFTIYGLYPFVIWIFFMFLQLGIVLHGFEATHNF